MAVVKKISAIKNSPKHLLGIQNLNFRVKNFNGKDLIKLNRSNTKKLDTLRGKTQINLFFRTFD